MTTALEIITDAYRESNITGIGVVPNSAQQDEGLRRLNAVISGALGFEIGEQLQDWQVGTVGLADGDCLSEQVWTRPIANVRLLLRAATPQTIFLPANPSDGARVSVVDVLGGLSGYPVTLDANGRSIEDAPTITLNEDALKRVWFYRADLGQWARISTLLIGSDMPFPAEHDDVFITLLAMRLNPRYGRALTAETNSWMERSLRALRARYKQKVIVGADPAVLSLTRTGPYYSGGPRIGWMS